MPRTTFTTLAEPVRAVGETVQGARFVARAAPIDPHDAARTAQAIVSLARDEESFAIHHGWAYRIGPLHADFRFSDDGEPVGVAGASILRRIDASSLLNVIVVVSRGSGAQRLSAGDLATGYASAASAALTAGRVITFVPKVVVTVEFDYPHAGPVQGVLNKHRAERVAGDYGASVSLTVQVASDDAEAMADALRQATAGTARVAIA